MRPFVQQQDENDSTTCGVRAVAFAVEMAEGCTYKELVGKRFVTSELVPHLVRCLEVGKFSPFPFTTPVKNPLNGNRKNKDVFTQSAATEAKRKTQHQHREWQDREEKQHDDSDSTDVDTEPRDQNQVRLETVSEWEEEWEEEQAEDHDNIVRRMTMSKECKQNLWRQHELTSKSVR